MNKTRLKKSNQSPKTNHKPYHLPFSVVIRQFVPENHSIQKHPHQTWILVQVQLENQRLMTWRVWLDCSLWAGQKASDFNTGVVCLALRQPPNYWDWYRRSPVQVHLKLGFKGQPQTCVQDYVGLMERGKKHLWSDKRLITLPPPQNWKCARWGSVALIRWLKHTEVW